VRWRFLDKRGLQIIDNSEPTLAPPSISGLKSTISADLIRPMLNQAFQHYGEASGITGLIPVTKDDYRT